GLDALGDRLRARRLRAHRDGFRWPGARRDDRRQGGLVTVPEDRSAPGPRAALLARSAFEEVLFAIQDIPVDLDRHDLRDRLLRAIHCTFAVRDTPVISAAHLDGLREAASMASESRTLLTRAGDPAAIDPLRRAVERLDTAIAA